MYFQLLKLILWPRIDAPPRIVEFDKATVNVISGASKTGKSAVIPIVDYCLGSDKCAIPVGAIRESCSWFGIVVETVEGQKLLARREPGEQQKTGDMVLIEAPEVAVPTRVEGKTTNVDNVKAMLNRLAGLSNLGFDPTSDTAAKNRPSFRDLMAFTFQPQNIVANPDVLFFKADTTEHREKLKTIFPYVLGAVTAEVLQARFELDRLMRILRRKEGELRTLMSATNAWRLEAQAWLRQAIEYGLLLPDSVLPTDWNAIVDLLRSIVGTNARAATPSLEGIDVGLSRLEELRKEESEAASVLTQDRQRLNELRRLKESSEAYGGAMHIQRDRLAISDWMRQLLQDGTPDPLVDMGGGGADRVLELCDTLNELEVRLRTLPSVSDTLDRETIRLRGAAEVTLERLNSVRREIQQLERNSAAAQETVNRFDRIERFLGRLEQALETYDRADQTSDLRQEIAGIQASINDLQKIVSQSEIERRQRNALSQIEATATKLIPQLDAEYPEAPIKLAIDDLTVKVIRGPRDDYLWEIGSGANWLAYHVCVMLALQHYFMTQPLHPVPHIVIFDQPSQVYFPKRAAHDDDVDDPVLRDEDILAVRKVFALLGAQVAEAGGRLQVIVLDHAFEDVWGGLPEVRLKEEWRGDALVPGDWLKSDS